MLFLAFLGIFLFFESISTVAVEDEGFFKVVQGVTSGMSISCDGSINLAPSFPSNPTGLTPQSGPSKDDFDCLIKTNNSGGFNLYVKNQDLGSGVSLVNEIDSSYKFYNYSQVPTYNWVDPPSGQALFGFTVGAENGSESASDVAVGFKNDGSDCGSGSNVNNSSDMDNAKCWRGLNDANDILIASSSDETNSSGEYFRFRFQARANAISLKAGDYVTNLTITATY